MFHPTTRTPRRTRGAVLVAALLLVQLLAACALGAAVPVAAQVGPPALVTLNSASSGSLQAGASSELEEFLSVLRAAFVDKDYAALSDLMADPFRLAIFEQYGRMIAPDEAVQELELEYLGPSPNPLFDEVNDLNFYLGVPTTDVWGDEIDVITTLFVRGLGEDGLADGLLAVSQDDAGDYRFAGLLVALEGFGAPPLEESAEAVEETMGAPEAAAAEAAEEPVQEPTEEEPALPANASPTTVISIDIVRTTNVYPAPDPEATPLGLLRRGQSLPVLAASLDGEYYLIQCPAGIEEQECWVVADPGAVQPVEAVEETPATAVPLATAALAEEQTGQGGRPERISFEQGAVAASRSGTVTPDAAVYYVLRIQAGQALTADLVSPGQVANFSIAGVTNGQPYKGIDDDARMWTFTVPATQDYLITIESPEAVEYMLTVIVPPLAPQQTATPVPTATSLPTATPLPTATSTPIPEPTASEAAAEAEAAAEGEAAGEEAAALGATEPERIRFGLGETSATLTGTLTPERGKQYIFNALAGQQIVVGFTSAGHAASYSIIGMDDAVLYKAMSVADPVFSFESPLRQDYIVNLDTGAATSYILTLEIPATLPQTPTPTPEPDEVDGMTRLRVPAGSTSVSVTDIISPGGSDAYLVRALEGQTMFVVLTSPEDIANFSIVGYDDGQPLKRVENEDRVWSGVLPATQDYVIRVVNPRNVRVQYTLDVEFSPLDDETPEPEPEAVRISVAPGATSATVTGSLAADESALYVLRAVEGQWMEAVLEASRPAYFTIYGADGTVLISPMAGASEWSGLLPATQDYFISVRAEAGIGASYALTVTFSPLSGEIPPTRLSTPPQRIQFASGAISAMVSGAAPSGGTQSYVLRAMGGQIMTVELYPTAAATFSVAGADGTVLKSSGAGGTSWSGELPSSQDYTITVVPVGGAVDFDLIVTVVS